MNISEWSFCPCIRVFPCQLFNLSSSLWSGCDASVADLCFHWVTIKLPQLNVKAYEESFLLPVLHRAVLDASRTHQTEEFLCIKQTKAASSTCWWAISKLWVTPSTPKFFIYVWSISENSVFTSPALFGSESAGLKLLCAESSGNSVRVWPKDYARLSVCLFIVKLIKNIRVFAS